MAQACLSAQSHSLAVNSSMTPTPAIQCSTRKGQSTLIRTCRAPAAVTFGSKVPPESLKRKCIRTLSHSKHKSKLCTHHHLSSALSHLRKLQRARDYNHGSEDEHRLGACAVLDPNKLWMASGVVSRVMRWLCRMAIVRRRHVRAPFLAVLQRRRRWRQHGTSAWRTRSVLLRRWWEPHLIGSARERRQRR